ncbi:hypothetical protein BDA96_03G040000 [Sorghum bicolor]|uniref:Uncharacterized protein n=2 Tax=Sorghum bicolor TaxID=4558 RepID=A0A921R919_SORBI|nr:hypothetical protein BDA96_03G040000 [Sorghum bicolor]OQU86168.1 hypothetical protein SORBI_3003G036650 [Sorghum bicolor]
MEQMVRTGPSESDGAMKPNHPSPVHLIYCSVKIIRLLDERTGSAKKYIRKDIQYMTREEFSQIVPEYDTPELSPSMQDRRKITLSYISVMKSSTPASNKQKSSSLSSASPSCSVADVFFHGTIEANDTSKCTC